MPGSSVLAGARHVDLSEVLPDLVQIFAPNADARVGDLYPDPPLGRTLHANGNGPLVRELDRIRHEVE
jgi:hypothetical protein